MQPETNQPEPPITIRRLNWGRAITLVALVVLVGTAGYFIYSRFSAKPSQVSTYKKGLHNQDYHSLETYKLNGSKQNGGGISFLKPVEFKLVFESQPKDQAAFSHTLQAPVYAPLGSIYVSSVATDKPISGQYLSALKQTFLKNKDHQDYKSAASTLEQYVSSRFSPLYDLNFAKATESKTANIKNNAWSINFTAVPKPRKVDAPAQPPSYFAVPEHDTTSEIKEATPKEAQKQASELEKYEGRLVFIAGKSTYYYLFAYNTDYNWSNNASTWQKVIDSIKIDQ